MTDTERRNELYPRRDMLARDLRPGDVVRAFEGPWGTAIVQRVEDDAVTLYRPYGTLANSVVYAGNRVICLQGCETWRICRDDSRPLFVYQREDLQ